MDKPHAIWTGVYAPENLTRLKHRIDHRLENLEIEPDHRKYTPHITLARMKNPPEGRVAQFLENHALFQAAPFDVRHITLYQSHLTKHGSEYEVLERFALT